MGLEVSTLEGLDYVEAVARPGPNVTMSGYCSVFECFLLYLASLATFPKFCGNIWATFGCPIWQNDLPWIRNAAAWSLPVVPRKVRFEC